MSEPYFFPRERFAGPDLTWKRCGDRATRCPRCGAHCRADKDNHHLRSSCAHYVGVMGPPEVYAQSADAGYQLVAQATIGQPDARDRWHVFRFRAQSDRRH